MDSETKTQSEKIIEKFGGLTALAKALGKPVTTVQGWKERGYIPSKHQETILAKARENKIRLSPADFFRAA